MANNKALKDFTYEEIKEEYLERVKKRFDEDFNDKVERRKALIFANTELTKDEVKNLPLEVVEILYNKFTNNN